MSVNAEVEVAVFVDKFHNLDLPKKGWYGVRVRCFWRKSLRRGTPARVLQYSPKELRPGESLTLWRIADDVDVDVGGSGSGEGGVSQCYYSCCFAIRHARQEVVLHEMVSFHLPLCLLDDDAVVQFDLLFMEAEAVAAASAASASTAPRGRQATSSKTAPPGPSVGPVLETQVASQSFVVPAGSWQGTHGYACATFDRLYFAQMDVTVHSVLLGFKPDPLRTGQLHLQPLQSASHTAPTTTDHASAPTSPSQNDAGSESVSAAGDGPVTVPPASAAAAQGSGAGLGVGATESGREHDELEIQSSTSECTKSSADLGGGGSAALASASLAPLSALDVVHVRKLGLLADSCVRLCTALRLWHTLGGLQVNHAEPLSCSMGSLAMPSSALHSDPGISTGWDAAQESNQLTTTAHLAERLIRLKSSQECAMSSSETVEDEEEEIFREMRAMSVHGRCVSPGSEVAGVGSGSSSSRSIMSGSSGQVDGGDGMSSSRQGDEEGNRGEDDVEEAVRKELSARVTAHWNHFLALHKREFNAISGHILKCAWRASRAEESSLFVSSLECATTADVLFGLGPGVATAPQNSGSSSSSSSTGGGGAGTGHGSEKSRCKVEGEGGVVANGSDGVPSGPAQRGSCAAQLSPGKVIDLRYSAANAGAQVPRLRCNVFSFSPTHRQLAHRQHQPQPPQCLQPQQAAGQQTPLPRSAALEVVAAGSEAQVDGKHVVVFVHGFQGNHMDLRLWRNHWRVLDPDAICVMSDANEHGSPAHDLAIMGAALAKEVVGMLAHMFGTHDRPNHRSKPLGRLSFVGHSVGTLVIRAALTDACLKPYLPHLHAFLSVSGPHLGYLYHANALVNSGLWLLRRVQGSAVMKQLSLADEADIRTCYLYELAQDTTWQRFKHVVFFSSRQDHYVPYHSARFEIPEAALRDPGRGGAFAAMVEGALGPLIRSGAAAGGAAAATAPASGQLITPTPDAEESEGAVSASVSRSVDPPETSNAATGRGGARSNSSGGLSKEPGCESLIRCDVDFSPAALQHSRSFNNILGRAAHIKFLDCDVYIQLFLWSHLHLILSHP